MARVKLYLFFLVSMLVHANVMTNLNALSHKALGHVKLIASKFIFMNPKMPRKEAMEKALDGFHKFHSDAELNKIDDVDDFNA